MAGTMAGIAAFHDSSFQTTRDWNNAREKPKDFFDSTKQSVKSIGKGFYLGATGIVSEPIKGAKKGKRELLKGICKGTAGVILKPTVGILDSVSKLSEGIKCNLNINRKMITRVRLPRYFARDCVLRPFNEEEAQILFDMQTSNYPKYAKEFLLDYFNLFEKRILITQKYFLIFYYENKSVEEFLISDIQNNGIVSSTENIIVKFQSSSTRRILAFPLPMIQNLNNRNCNNIINQIIHVDIKEVEEIYTKTAEITNQISQLVEKIKFDSL